MEIETSIASEIRSAKNAVTAEKEQEIIIQFLKISINHKI
jgi:hypothetical protein